MPIVSCRAKSDMLIQRLDKPVSSQVVAASSLASVTSAVKELVENSIDACGSKKGAQIYVEIDDNSGGLEHLLIRDNGVGVASDDRKVMCLNHTTSKITKWEDLETNLTTCGFRGEALHCICQVAQKVQISTKTEEDTVCETWEVTNSGLVDGVFRRSSGSTGTTVKIEGLFKRTPVRYNFYRKEKKRTLQRIHTMFLSYSLIYPFIRFQVKYVRVLPNGKVAPVESTTFNGGLNAMQHLRNELNIRNANSLFTMKRAFTVTAIKGAEYSVSIDGVFPKSTASEAVVLKKSVKVLCVNNRLLNIKLNIGKSISKKISEAFTENLLIAPQVWFMKLTLPNQCIDVNIEPEKSDILVNSEESFLESLFSCLKEYLLEIHGEQQNEPRSRSGPILVDTQTSNALSENDHEDDGNDVSMLTILGGIVEKAQSSVGKAYGDDELVEVLNTNSKVSERTSDDLPILSSEVENEDNQDLLQLYGDIYKQSDQTEELSIDDTGIGAETVVALPNGIVLNDRNSETLDDAEQNGAHSVTIVDGVALSAHNDGSEGFGAGGEHDADVSGVVNSRGVTKIAVHMKSNSDDQQTTNNADLTYLPELTVTDCSKSEEPEVPKLAIRATLGPHITHTINASPRKKRPRVQSQIPSKMAPYKVTEMTQNTLGIVVGRSFPVGESYARNVVDFEEKWNGRSGIPSEVVLEGLKELYLTQQYQLLSDHGTLAVNEIGLAKLE